MYLDNSQAALTNTQKLISELRPLWEEDDDITHKTGAKEIELIKCNHEPLNCELSIPITELIEYLEGRIALGIEDFYVSLRQAFQSRVPEEVYLLLGGNASRSKIVQGFFGLLDDAKGKELHESASKWIPEGIKINSHLPLTADENDEYRATAKTGVALGLLSLCPGGAIKLVKSDIETPFAFFVGWIREKKFAPNLIRGAQYHKWHLIGQCRDNVFNIVYTQSSRVMKQGDLNLTEKRVVFTGNKTGGTACLPGPFLLMKLRYAG